ncbi:MAG: hypothetical protein GH143_07660 [Calditrichaeota bacterium]|nr:hypothetical protein [Calditrichota bacterium]
MRLILLGGAFRCTGGAPGAGFTIVAGDRSWLVDIAIAVWLGRTADPAARPPPACPEAVSGDCPGHGC